MPWNPAVYNQFKDIRYRPFFDLADLLKPEGVQRAVDLGCGTGEQTSILAQRFPRISFFGLDASAEMLSKAAVYELENLHFEKKSIEDFIESDDKWDILFSNAALQWVDNHEVLFPKLLTLLNPNGQFAVQMPVQTDNILNRILLELVNEEPFTTYLKGWRRDSPVLAMDSYTQLLFENGITDIQLMQKVYPIIAETHDMLFDFIAGSALIPYMERLENEQQEYLVEIFKARIAGHFTKLPAIYAFKRILLYARKNDD